MITLFYTFLIISLVLYLAAFVYEAWHSFARLSSHRDSGYIHATWEITHTLLVLTIVAFVMTHSSVIQEIAKESFLSLFVAVMAFIIRAALFLVLFYGRDERRKRIGVLDHLFAWSHIIILAGLVLGTLQTITVLTTHVYTINIESAAWYMTGLIGIIVICSVPLTWLYRTK